jgi:hypothetical protein
MRTSTSLTSSFQDQIDLVQVDWHGQIVWRFSELERIADPGETPRFMARQHHDFQRQGNPVGYYVPGQDPETRSGHTFLLVHENVRAPEISEHPLLDDKIIEVDWNGKIVWQWRAHEHFAELGFDTPKEAGFVQPLDAYRFYSPFISSAQRLPNGNTLITEGSNGRLLEVTREHEIVWEYINPYFGTGRLAMNMIYRAYRYPHAWAPVEPSRPQPIYRVDNRSFRVPGAAAPGALHVAEVVGVSAAEQDVAFCVATDRDADSVA